MLSTPTPFGLYFHIPFCTRLCHYCDFVKTAWHEEELQENYIRALALRTQQWLEVCHRSLAGHQGLDSVFFGGGTPSLLDRGYAPLFELLKPSLKAEAEVSLEANPEHISDEKLRIWTELGFNRISLGVQSFQPEGLRFLTREHTPETAADAVAASMRKFKSVNIDLIYGWEGQTETSWLADIEQALALGVQHLSLYSLTFEGRTPMARRVQRGVLEPSSDERLEAYYRIACERLAAAGMVHEEVSNWAYPGFQSRHNSIYWHGGSYVGLGSGAHSYLDSQGPWGERWHQDSSWRRFATLEASSPKDLSLQALLAEKEYAIESGRDAEVWILEIVSSGLRSLKGINLGAICRRTGYILQPRPAVATALEQGLLRLNPEGQLTLVEAEWYRETRWALEVSLSLRPA